MTKAIILAAGVGRRLGAAGGGPKILLEFGGRSLLERHLTALERHGVRDVALTVGHRGRAIRDALDRTDRLAQVSLIENPDYRLGSMVSLWCQRHTLCAGGPVLVMDGDVLYEEAVLGRLLSSPAENALLVDRHIEPGDEPVKICFRDAVIADFRKRPVNPHDWYGESVGFFRFSERTARALAARCSWYVERGETGLEYEEAIRDLILEDPTRFAAEDVTGLAWTEIDFAEDVTRARDEILPRIGR